MADILQEIVAHKRREVAAARERIPARELYRSVEALMAGVESSASMPPRSMRAALSDACVRLGAGIIAEFKRKSPSKGWIHPDAEPEDVVPAYAQAGAAALSILTDEMYFGGRQEYVTRVRPLVPHTPILRKDFIVDEYQLFEARLIGADAVLLIAADLTVPEFRTLLRTAHSLNLEVLLEVHDPHELDYVVPEVDMIGVNNRHLGTFHTDVAQSFAIAQLLPRDFMLVSESGIGDPDTVLRLRQAGFSGFLIGETFMRQSDPADALRSFIARCQPEGKADI